MYKYDVCVKNCEHYDIYADSDEEAKVKAIDCFKDDDMWCGSEEAEYVTEKDSEIYSREEW